MTSSQFSKRLFEAEPDSPAITALARDLVEDARYPANFTVRHSLPSNDAEEQMKGKNLLAELGELALVPLSQSARWPDVATELWTLRTMAAELVSFRRRTAEVLKDLLSNRYPAPAANMRVADLAFIQLHRMLHVALSPAAFLEMPADERDKRITEFQESPAFRYAFESQS
jgi:hypothetical protein